MGRPRHGSLTAIAVNLYQAQQQGESYESAKRRLALELSTADWAELDNLYNALDGEGWGVINPVAVRLTAPDRSLLLAGLRCLQEQMGKSGQRTFWRQDTGLATVATNEGAFSLPTNSSINELCGRISGRAAQLDSTVDMHPEATP